jgi:BolA protein
VSDVARSVHEILQAHLRPEHLEIHDQSAQHAGHLGAAEGGAHLSVVIVSTAFAGRDRLERHRMVYEALAGLVGGPIHALALKARTPEEWEEERHGA